MPQRLLDETRSAMNEGRMVMGALQARLNEAVETNRMLHDVLQRQRQEAEELRKDWRAQIQKIQSLQNKLEPRRSPRLAKRKKRSG